MHLTSRLLRRSIRILHRRTLRKVSYLALRVFSDSSKMRRCRCSLLALRSCQCCTRSVPWPLLQPTMQVTVLRHRSAAPPPTYQWRRKSENVGFSWQILAKPSSNPAKPAVPPEFGVRSDPFSICCRCSRLATWSCQCCTRSVPATTAKMGCGRCSRFALVSCHCCTRQSLERERRRRRQGLQLEQQILAKPAVPPGADPGPPERLHAGPPEMLEQPQRAVPPGADSGLPERLKQP